MLIDTDDTRFDGPDGEALSALLARVRTVGGVVVFATTGRPAAPADGETPAQPRESVFGHGEEELAVHSDSADPFDSVEDLAPGLHDLSVDRIILAGSDTAGAVRASADAALACDFDVVLVRDSILGGDWIDEVVVTGAMASEAAGVWLRM